jgi:hypothetical protein
MDKYVNLKWVNIQIAKFLLDIQSIFTIYVYIKLRLMLCTLHIVCAIDYQNG